METAKEKPTKEEKYKYDSREEALAAKRKRSNRAHRERRRRAVERLMAANEDIQSPTMTKRGGQKTWKMPVRRRYNRDLRRQKQQKKRRQAVNRQIWQRLQALVPRAEETATSLMQLANTVEERTSSHRAGEDVLQRAMAGRHWIALGDDYENEETNAGRKIKDGVLLRVAVSVAGRRCVALIDSGASQSYCSPETVALCEIVCSPASVYLELADGSKIEATQQTLATPCTVGKAVCKISFTVTKLLSNVDIVLGMDWLMTWNPVIDWRKQRLHLWVHGQWNYVDGVLMNAEQPVGTVKVFDSYSWGHDSVPDISVVKKPQFWERNTERKEEKQIDVSQSVNGTKTAKYMALENETVQQRKRTTSIGQIQIISSKRVVKLIKRGEPMFLAMIRPTVQKKQGITQKVKQQKMKETGPVRKAPPVAETRRRMCLDAPADVRTELQHLLQEYADLFPEQLPKGRPPKRSVEFEINTEEGVKPPSKPPYRLSPKEYEELQAQIDELLAQGHIRPSTSPYGAPVLFVPKKDGRWRMCVDYRALNRQTIKDKYPLPRIDDLLDRLGRAKHFSTLDLASGYHQIAVKASDIPKTAFRTQRGQFEFIVMPFGVTNAPATFQRLMNNLFKEDLDAFVAVYLDDILIFSQTLQEHIIHIRQALEKLRQAKMYARLHKCSFFQERVEYLGFEVSAQGVQPSPEKVRTIVEWPRPQSVKDVRSFLGLAGFYRRFIKQFSLKARPLTDLTKEKTTWQWTEKEENSFCNLKKSLVIAPVLRMPNFDLSFIVTTDASLVSVGAILEQDFGQGLQPVAYESRKLNPAETRYSAYERELLGIVWAIGKWRHYLEGRHFIVQTDHSSLKHLPNQPSVSRRIWKWVSILQGYDIDIRHIPGKVNPADALTRQVRADDVEYAGRVRQQDQDWMESVRVPSEATDQEIQRKLNELYSTKEQEDKRQEAMQLVRPTHNSEQSTILAIAESSISIEAQMRQRMMIELRNEDQYADIINKLEDPNEMNEVQINDKCYRIKQGTLKVHEQRQAETNNYWRTVVPNVQDIKLQLLREIHAVPYAGHPGYTRTLEVTKQFFFWVNMTTEVRQFVLDCPVCQVEKGSHLKPSGKLMPLDLPGRKWDHVAIDFVVGMPVQQNCDTILTVVDKATKMCHFIACSERISAKEVAQLYWQHVGRLHGIPSVLISDRDVRFTSRFWRELWRVLGTDLRMGSGFHPESSGQVEKFNQLLEQTLRCTIHQLGEGRNWVDMLPTIEFSVNNTPNRTTGYSAFYLNFGFHPLHPLQLLHSATDSYNESVVSFVSRLQVDFDRAQQQLTRAREQMIQQEDPHRRASEYRVGDRVLLSTRYIRFRNCPQKLQRRFVGPFEIIRKMSRAAYELKLPDAWSIHPVFHVSLLKPWRESIWSSPVDLQPADIEPETRQTYTVERILRWRKVQMGRRRVREFLVTWHGYPLEEAMWIPEQNFPYPQELKQMLKQDRPVEDRGPSSHD